MTKSINGIESDNIVELKLRLQDVETALVVWLKNELVRGFVRGFSRGPPPIRLYFVAAPHHVEATRHFRLARPQSMKGPSIIPRYSFHKRFGLQNPFILCLSGHF